MSVQRSQWDAMFKELRRRGQWKKALTIVRELRLAYPTDPSLSRDEVTILSELGAWDQVVERSDTHLAHSPQDAQVLHDRAWALYRQGRWDDALVVVDNAIKVEEGATSKRQLVLNRAVKAQILFRLDRLQDAQPLLEQAIFLGDEEMMSLLLPMRARSLFRLGNYEEALATARQAIATPSLRDDDQWEALWQVAGECLVRLEQWEDLVRLDEQGLTQGIDLTNLLSDSPLARLRQTTPSSDTFLVRESVTPRFPEASSAGDGKRWSSIAGMAAVKQVLEDRVLNVLQQRAIYQRYGLAIPNGILLFGPPGCGKTLFAKSLAKELGWKSRICGPGDFANTYVHGATEKVEQVFSQAASDAPCVLVLDEITALLARRQSDDWKHWLELTEQFLAKLSDCRKHSVLVVASTNMVEQVDDAILRPGRMDVVIYIPPPDFAAREAILNFYLAERPMKEDMHYDVLALATDGYTAADLSAVVNGAAMLALTDSLKSERLVPITESHFFSSLRMNPPSLTAEQLKNHEELARKYARGMRDSTNEGTSDG